MKKRTLIFALLILVLPMILAACGGGLDEGELEDAIQKAIKDGDTGDINDLLCKDDQIEGDNLVTADVDKVDCTVDDKDVECKITASVEDQSIEFTITGKVDDDDKLCDLDFQEPELPDVEVPDVETPEVEVTPAG